ncbi:MAG: nuclear transport factor 2 family protein [Pseudomonadota bacterium]
MDEERAVSEADDKFFAALNAMFVGDLEPMKALWSHADDVAYLGPAGIFLTGWPAILEDWEKQAALKLGGEIHVTQRHLTVGDGLAVAHHRAEATNRDRNGNMVDVSLRGTNVFRKEDGEWRLIAHHADPLAFLEY